AGVYASMVPITMIGCAGYILTTLCLTNLRTFTSLHYRRSRGRPLPWPDRRDRGGYRPEEIPVSAPMSLPLAATIVQAKPMTEGFIDKEGCLQVWGGEPYARGIVRNIEKGAKLTIIENDTIGPRVARYRPPAQSRGDPRG